MSASHENRVAVIDTGTANQASIVSGLLRAGASQPRIVRAAEDIADATHLVLPGVGTFGAAMERLSGRRLVEPIREWIAADRPLLAVCVGLQVLFESSEESPGVAGLGVLPGRVIGLRAAGDNLRLPHMGWNAVRGDPTAGAALIDGDAYFANSFARQMDAGLAGCARCCIATTTYGVEFLSAIRRGRLLGCQFHPELSGDFGIGLILRWPSGSTASEHDRSALPRTAGLTTRIIPCLDVCSGRVVKGVKFANLRDAGDPVESAVLYEAGGADELVVLDVSATREDRHAHIETIESIRRHISIPLTVGGGVRGIEDVARLLEAGADKVAINTAAVADPSILDAVSRRFGRQCTILAIDAARRDDDAPGAFEVVTHAGTRRSGRDAIEWAEEAVGRGAGEILLTSFDRDGTRSGYELELLRAICAAVGTPVIASGGAASAAHLAEAIEAGASAVLAASIFHDRETTVEAVKRELASCGCAVRLSADDAVSERGAS